MRILVLTMIVASFSSGALAQDCNAIINQMRAAAGAGNLGALYQLEARYNACAAGSRRHEPQHPQPLRQQPVRPQPSRAEPHHERTPSAYNVYNNPAMRAEVALGAKLMSRAPLRQDIPVSGGLVQQEIYAAPPNYVDPFARRENLSPQLPMASRAPPAVSPPSGITQEQLKYLRDNKVTLQPYYPLGSSHSKQ